MISLVNKDLLYLLQGELLVSWRNLQEKGSESTLVDSLSEMYDILLSTWHSQVSPAPLSFFICQLVRILIEKLELRI